MGSLLFAGCNLYFGDDDDCKAYSGDDVAEWPLRNPQTGECELQGGWGGGVCGRVAPNTGGALPNWAACGGACDALAENQCLATPGCHAEYTGFVCPPGADCTALWSGTAFWTCAASAPYSTLPPPGTCWGLDAQSCSSRDDCSSVYQMPIDPGHHSFNQCMPERALAECTSDSECPSGYECNAATVCYPPPGCDSNCPTCGACPAVCYGTCVPKSDVCGGVDCGPGAHCEPQCYPCDKVDPNDVCMTQCQPTCVPDQDSCATVDCAPGTHCEESCTGVCDPNTGVMCPPSTCKIECVPDVQDPGDCYGPVACDAAPPACPASTTPGVKNGCWTGFCIPINECSHDPGTCDGPVACAVPPPACPVNTVPGVKNGCWSGYCIPDWACTTTITCEAITTEQACIARADCSPIYDGKNCTCDPAGNCTCQDKSFARCTTGWKPA